MKLLFATLAAVGLFFSGVAGLNSSAKPDPTGVRAFEEPLVSIGSHSIEEDTALVAALQSFQKRKSYEDVSAITDFLATYPKSSWKFSLLANLGIVYRKTGYFSRAVDTWEQAWAMGKNEKNTQVQNLSNRVVGELANLLSSLGRTGRVAALLKETGNRTIYGSANTMLLSARESLWLMKNRPETSFKCGPYALDSIRTFADKKVAHDKLIEQARSSAKGFSLTQVRDLSNALKMGYQMAKRETGAEFITPSVAHWKSGHYAAILKKNGDRYLTKDPTFGQEIWVTAQALEDESDGYMLVPSGVLPKSWQIVSDTEGNSVFGQGVVAGRTPDASKSTDIRTCHCYAPGMPVYSILLMLTSLSIEDTPVGYIPAIGPDVQFTITYNQLEANQPSSYNYFNFGPCWNSSWLSYVTLPVSGVAYVNTRGGGRETYTSSGSPVTDSSGYVNNYATQVQGQTTLWVSSSGTSYERRMSDGSKEIFSQPSSVSSPLYMFLTAIVDPQGNTVTLTYDSSYLTSTGNLRLTTITDALGLSTSLTYGLPGDPLKVTQITDPYDRTAAFAYTSYSSTYQLTSITDEMSITSSFTYGSGSDISQMVTPYGITYFSTTARGGIANPDDTLAVRYVNVTEPDGGQVYAESRIDGLYYPYSNSESLVPSVIGRSFDDAPLMQNRNTYYWDKKAMQATSNNPDSDYTKAYIYHWLHGDLSNTSESPVLESERPPLENRIWYAYDGQSGGYTIYPGTSDKPTIVARAIDSSHTQNWQYEYGNTANPALVTKMTDPMRRITYYGYDTNNIDLVSISRQKGVATDTLATITYDASFPAHCPKTITDVSGQTTSFTYNAQGQILTVTPPTRSGHSAETTTYGYTGNYLTSITKPLTGAVTTLGYATLGSGGCLINRIHTMTDSEGYTLTASYDALDRLTEIDYPDSTKDRFSYSTSSRPLDLSDSYDRLNHHTHYVYDAVRHLTSVTDPLSQTTSYDWCSCGSLNSITDANSHVTTFIRDVEGRVTSKVYQGESTPSSDQYTYDSVGRLHVYQNKRLDTTTYNYNPDNTISGISYSLGSGSTSVLPVDLTYTYGDTYYQRITSISSLSGLGQVDIAYNAVGSLGACKPHTITNTMTGGSAIITYTYDEWNRIVGRSIDSGNNETATLDSLGRATSIVNALCPTSTSFSYTYFDPTHPTNRLGSISYPNGQTTTFDYFNSYGSFSSTGDENLKQIKNLNPSSAVMSQNDYTVDAMGKILTWKQQADSNTPLLWTEGYDVADQLTSAVKTNTSTFAAIAGQSYIYDVVGNRQQEQNYDQTATGIFNGANQLTALDTANTTPIFSGTLSGPDTLTVNGSSVTVDSHHNFNTTLTLPTGTNTVAMVARDSAGNQRTNKYQLTVYSGSVSPTYDLDGNELTNGTGQSYTWDIKNQLIAIVYTAGPNSGNHTEFTYDALGRRIKIVERTGTTINSGTVTSTKQLVWNQVTIAEERDASNAVTKHFFPQGERIGSNNYYYAFDHLGSIREMTDSSGVVQARYDYDSYGKSTKVSGTLDSDFQYGSYYEHAASGLNLTLFRVYDPNTTRWLSRDPIAEQGGINLYGYALNNSINRTDQLGLRADFTLTNGAEISVCSADQFRNLVNTLPNNSILNITIDGHAVPWIQTFGVAWTDFYGTGSQLTIDHLGQIVLKQTSNETGISLITLLKNKLTKNATINLRGCHAGDSSQIPSIAQVLSKNLNISTKGSSGDEGLYFNKSSGYNAYTNGVPNGSGNW